MKRYAAQSLVLALGLTPLANPHAHAAITESGDIVVTDDDITYGDTAFATLLVNSGSVFSPVSPADPADPFSVFLGRSAGGTGLATIRDAGSVFNVDDNLNIGLSGGTGRLTVFNGATVNVARQTIINSIDATDSGITVASPGSVYNGGDRDFIVFQGRVLVQNEGRINALNPDNGVVKVRIGEIPGSTAQLIVQSGGIFDATASPAEPGNNSSTRDGDVFIGNGGGPSGGQAIVTVQSGGQFLADQVLIRSPKDTPASITVTGPGTQFTALRRIEASVGASNMLVTDGAAVQTVNYELGGTGTGTHTLTVSDGAAVLATGNIQVGRLGGTGVLSVSSPGTTVQANSQFSIAWPGPNSTGTVDIGAGTTLTANGQGFRLAQQSNSVANIIFRIGDVGGGVFDSGTVIATDLRFGQGTSTFDLLLDPGVTLELGDKFVLIDYGNDGNGIDDEDLRFDIEDNGFAGIADGGIITRGGYDFLIDYDDDLGGGDLAFTATVVPEPTSLALLALGGMLVARRRA
ncbi:MAG: PEP-CTERM sorting domain-containing protein [Planctomycetota bacterium]